MKLHLLGFLVFCIGLLSGSCKNEAVHSATPPTNNNPVQIPAANADSLYSFVEKQVSFGFRVPGTAEHKACGDWLAAKFASYGADVQIQKFKSSFQGNQDVESFNIIAQYNPAIKKRILLAAHWDTRMIAEKDPDKEKRDQPIVGADDGASGVAGLLEIARLLQQSPINLGVDLILFDAEDQGVNNGREETWCLGSQHWSKNKHKRNYTAKFGILLDMIGAKGAAFGKEGVSRQYASNVLDKVWSLGQAMGYSDLFVNTNFGSIHDDHLYVNRYAGIPMIDIINYNFQRNVFASYHHTHQDNMSIIDKRTLRVVTQVVLAALYRESESTL